MARKSKKQDLDSKYIIALVLALLFLGMVYFWRVDQVIAYYLWK